MYRKFFGLKTLPFKITPEVEMFYKGGSREQILDALIYTIARGDGILKVTGEVGSGKTMLLRLLATKVPSTYEVIYINSPNLSAKDIILYICSELKIKVSSHSQKYDLTNKINSKLLELHGAGKRVVMLIDEAQAMTFDALEEIRLLSNIETNDEKLLQMVLFGQPELDVALNNSKIRQIKSRISYSLYVPPLTVQEVHAYLNYRMRQSGYKGLDVFDFKIAKKIRNMTGGLPRNINMLADKILMVAFGASDIKISSKHFKSLPQLDFQVSNNRNWITIVGIVFLVVVMALGVGYSVFVDDRPTPDFNDQTPATQYLNDKKTDELGANDEDDLQVLTEKQAPLSDENLEPVELVTVVVSDKHVNNDLTALESAQHKQEKMGEYGDRKHQNLDKKVNVEPKPSVQERTPTVNNLSTKDRERLRVLIKSHVQARDYIFKANTDYIIQLSNNSFLSRSFALSHFKTAGLPPKGVLTLIHYDQQEGAFRLKSFYTLSNSFSGLTRVIQNLPPKVREARPFVLDTVDLYESIKITDSKLKEIGIYNGIE